ncbi:ATP synthase subunit I [Sporomusa aerivorans]|uniref:ATP synthase subunit I n=1 Tax=Sporomusa aerivorans TaxID=204936 RepID=UPI003529E631
MAKATCMKNYELKVRNMLAQIAVLGIIFCPIVFSYYSGQTMAGLLLGMVTGSIYFLYLYRQVENVKVLSKKQAVEHIRSGWIIRLGVMLLVLIVVSHFLKLNVLAFIAGFFTMPVLLFINGMAMVIKQIEDAKKM